MKHPTPPRASRPPHEGATADHEEEAPATDYPPEVKALTRRLRAFIRETIPEAEERPYKDGRSAGYHAPNCGAFCGLFPRRDAVYVAFPWGDLLPDETGLLAGSSGRFAVMRPEVEVPEEALAKLLLAAVLVGRGRGKGREMAP